MIYGIFDTRDSLYLGNSRGPLRYTDRALAQAVCQVVADMTLDTDLSARYEVREMGAGRYRQRDEVAIVRSAEESLRRIEGGGE